jgi:cyclic pyranopterin monophosphate synthase
MRLLTHINANGCANMVDVSGKAVTQRVARASAILLMQPTTLALIENNELSKGDVMAVARIAAIQAAKRCDELIPLCHSLPLSATEVSFSSDHEAGTLRIETRCVASAQTGVEMEALTAATIAALTVYDMCKSADRSMVVQEVMLLSKTGGKSGDWVRSDRGAKKGQSR